MKIFLHSIISICLLSSVSFNTYSQSTREERKARKEYLKDSRKMLDLKVSKIAQKEAKKKEKAGWIAFGGAQPIAKQLDRSYIIDEEIDDDGLPLYITSTRISIGSNNDGARSTAMALAIQDIANQMESEVAGIIRTSVGNSELSEEEAESLVQISSESKSFFKQKLGRVVPIIEMYRILPNKKREVEIRMAYSKSKAIAIAKQTIQEQLRERSDSLSAQLERKLGW